MGTFLKYLFYIVLIVVVYLVAKGIYTGDINEKTTVGQVVSNVESGSKQIVKEGVDAAQNAVDDYKKEPKKEIKIGE